MRVCKIKNCGGSHEGYGYCNKHYQRFKKYGDPLFVTRIYDHDGKCSILGCTAAYFGKNLCLFHYNNSDTVKSRKDKWSSTVETRYASLINIARKFGREMSLSFSEFVTLVSQDCYYGCGNPLAKTGYGLDRVDNTRGYSKDNVVPCCTSCNRMRRDDFTVEETKVMIQALLQFRKACNEAS